MIRILIVEDEAYFNLIRLKSDKSELSLYLRL